MRCKICDKEATLPSGHCDGFCKLGKQATLMQWVTNKFEISDVYLRDKSWLYINHTAVKHWLVVHKLFCGESMLSTADCEKRWSLYEREFFRGTDAECLNIAKDEAIIRCLPLVIIGYKEGVLL